MKLTLLLADAAQVDSSHKVSALGLGWSRVSSPLPPITIVMFVELEHGERHIKPTIHVRLTDENGELAQTSEESPLMYRFVPEATEIDPKAIDSYRFVLPFAIGVGPGLRLAPGRYKFVAEIEGQDLTSEQGFEVVDRPQVEADE